MQLVDDEAAHELEAEGECEGRQPLEGEAAGARRVVHIHLRTGDRYLDICTPVSATCLSKNMFPLLKVP